MFLTVATGWFRFWNYHEFQWIVSNTKPKDVIPDCSIWFSSYLPQQPTMNNRTTEKVNHHTTTTLAVDKRMNQVAFLQILVPGSETLPTSANICQHLPTSTNICLLNQPLIQAVACSSGRYPPDMCISDAVRRSKDGQARFPKFCDAAMLLLFCYHVMSLISCDP